MRLLTTLLLLCSTAFAENGVAPEEEQNEFHFIVLGDAQFDHPSAFNRLVDQTARLYPAFVIQVGDLIDGYNSDLPTIREEWRRFQNQIAPLGDIPFYAIAGNHDVYGSNKKPDKQLEALFEEVWGPLYFSFTYKNALFIGLNSDDHTSMDQVSDYQIEWMKSVLANSDATHRFVFLHKPPMLMKNADVLHEAFVAGEVSEVIYGHHHHLHHFERDGVKYTMTNAGGRMAHEVKAVGGFPHLLHVAVRGEDVSVAVVEADAVHAQDMVAPADNYDLFNLGRSLAADELKLREQGDQFTIELKLRNPTQRDITAYISCSSDDGRWYFEPSKFDPITLTSGARDQLSIRTYFDADRQPESLPECLVKVPFRTTGGEWFNFEQEVTTRY